MKERETDRKGGVFPNAHSQERASVNLSKLINTHISTQNPGALNTSPVAFTLCPVHCPGFCPHRQPQKERSHQLLSLSFCRRQKGKRRSRAPWVTKGRSCVCKPVPGFPPGHGEPGWLQVHSPLRVLSLLSSSASLDGAFQRPGPWKA